MKIKLLLIIGIYFLSINNTYANSIDNLEISPNEQWMVESLLEKDPNLSRSNIQRIEYSFGTYYGEVNSSGLPHGQGILGITDYELNPEGYTFGLLTEYKNGKLKRTREMSWVVPPNSNLGDSTAIWFAHVSVQNQLFGNSINLSADLMDLININLDILLNNLRTMDQSKCNQTCRVFIGELDNLVNQINLNPETLNSAITEILTMTETISEDLQNDLDWAQSRINPFFLALYTQLYGVRNIRDGGWSPMNVDRSLDSEEIREIKESIEYINNLSSVISSYISIAFIDDALLGINYDVLGGLVENSNSILNFIALQNKNEGSPFQQFRITNSFNLRDNERANFVEARMPNGKWYDVELNPETGFYQFTQSASRNYQNDVGQDGGGGAGGGW